MLSWSSLASCVTLLLLSLLSPAHGIGVEIRRNTERCVFEEIGSDLLVVVEYETEQPVNVRITNADLATILKESSAGGKDKLAFSTTKEGVYGICFLSKQAQIAYTTVRAGVDAKDYSDVVKREHLEPVELTMLHVEEEVQALLTQLIHQREHEMQIAKTTTDVVGRVYYLSVFVIVIVAAVGAWEARHMQNFLKVKKII